MIETARLTLRRHLAEDFEACHAIRQEPVVKKYISGATPTEDESWVRFLGFFGRWDVMGYGLFAVIEKSSNRYIGEVGYSDFRRGLGPDFDPFHEAAWILSGTCHGKGYGLEAMTAVQKWLDEKFTPEKTVCIISPENIASIRLAEKLGFRPTGQSTYKQEPVRLFERLKPT